MIILLKKVMFYTKNPDDDFFLNVRIFKKKVHTEIAVEFR